MDIGNGSNDCFNFTIMHAYPLFPLSFTLSLFLSVPEYCKKTSFLGCMAKVRDEGDCEGAIATYSQGRRVGAVFCVPLQSDMHHFLSPNKTTKVKHIHASRFSQPFGISKTMHEALDNETF